MFAHTWPSTLKWAIFFPIWISCTCAGRMFESLVHPGRLRWNPTKRIFGRWVSFFNWVILGCFLALRSNFQGWGIREPYSNIQPIPANHPQVPAQHCRQRSSWSTLLGRNFVGLPTGDLWFPGFPFWNAFMLVKSTDDKMRQKQLIENLHSHPPLVRCFVLVHDVVGFSQDSVSFVLLFWKDSCWFWLVLMDIVGICCRASSLCQSQSRSTHQPPQTKTTHKQTNKKVFLTRNNGILAWCLFGPTRMMQRSSKLRNMTVFSCFRAAGWIGLEIAQEPGLWTDPGHSSEGTSSY